MYATNLSGKTKTVRATIDSICSMIVFLCPTFKGKSRQSELEMFLTPLKLEGFGNLLRSSHI